MFQQRQYASIVYLLVSRKGTQSLSQRKRIGLQEKALRDSSESIVNILTPREITYNIKRDIRF